MHFHKALKRNVAIEHRGVAARIWFAVLGLACITPLLYFAFCVCAAEYPVLTRGDLESYTTAIWHDPTNGEYWWMRGRFRHFDLESMDLSAAISDYERALRLNPRLDKAWLDLADAYERTGAAGQAEIAIQNALRVHTYSPSARWQAGNFYLLRGNLPKMYECFKTAGESDIDTLKPALELVWQVDPDHTGIQRKLVSENLPSYLIYVNFLVAHDELDLAKAAWESSMKMPIPAQFQFGVSTAFSLIDRLLLVNRGKEAFRIWQESMKKAGSQAVDDRFTFGGNLLWNGSFETAILNGGFDWRYSNVDGAELQVDAAEHFHANKSLKLSFASSNVRYSNLRQVLPSLAPGSYRLEYYAKTEGLTSDQLPYFAIRPFPENGETYHKTQMVPAGSSWEKHSSEFAILPGTQAVQLMLCRDLSTKLGNKIGGSLWLDQISIRAQHQAELPDEKSGRP